VAKSVVTIRVLSGIASSLVFSSGSLNRLPLLVFEASSTHFQLSYQPLNRSFWSVFPTIIGRSGVGVGWVKGIRRIGPQYWREPIIHLNSAAPRHPKKQKGIWSKKSGGDFYKRSDI
jgi:hypothetical protein